MARFRTAAVGDDAALRHISPMLMLIASSSTYKYSDHHIVSVSPGLYASSFSRAVASRQHLTSRLRHRLGRPRRESVRSAAGFAPKPLADPRHGKFRRMGPLPGPDVGKCRPFSQEVEESQAKDFQAGRHQPPIGNRPPGRWRRPSTRTIGCCNGRPTARKHFAGMFLVRYTAYLVPPAEA